MFKEILLNKNISIYEEFFNKATFKTIYHHPRYLLAEEKAENYNIYIYIYEEGDDFVVFPGVKRRINDISLYINEEERYDLITPHEYSGVLSNKYCIELFEKFYDEMEAYCIGNKIVSCFIRFNPYSEEHRAAKNFNTILSDKQNRVECNDHVLDNFQKRKARYVKSAIKNGMELKEMEKNIYNIKTFFSYYTKAMKRLGAKSFLYFNLEYFIELCRNEFVKLFFVIDNKTQDILSGIIILCDEEKKRMYHHLSFRNSNVGKMHSMEYMIFATSKWAQEKGYREMHLGGGSESLHQFKDGCTNKRVDYYIGTKIYDSETYEKLIHKLNDKYPEYIEKIYFPKYRIIEK